MDPVQNWDLLNAEEEDGYTVLEFTRDWVTCDEERDRVIDVSDTFFSLAYSYIVKVHLHTWYLSNLLQF